MKVIKTSITVGVLVVLMCTVTSSAVAKDISSVYSFNLVSLLLTSVDIEGEWTRGNRNAWTVRAFRTIGPVSGGERDDWSPYGIGGGYRRFFSPTAPASGHGGIGITIIASGEPMGGEFFLGPEVELGYRWLWGKFAITLRGELNYYMTSADEDIAPVQGVGHVLPGKGLATGITVGIGYGK